EALEPYQNPAVRLLLRRRALDKMRSTYTDYSLDSNDFFHGDVSFTAATGRARGFLMTLQKGMMRSIFIPDEPGWEFLYADWNRIELWISAIESGDLKMQEVLTKENFHDFVARGCFTTYKGKKESKETYERTKFITHGANFGRSETSISRDHDIPLDVVRRVV